MAQHDWMMVGENLVTEVRSFVCRCCQQEFVEPSYGTNLTARQTWCPGWCECSGSDGRFERRKTRMGVPTRYWPNVKHRRGIAGCWHTVAPPKEVSHAG